MANRFPLIVDSSALQIKELPASDNLDLANSSIVNVVDITASGTVSVGGTLTYEDVTNVDSVGVITARDGIRLGKVGFGATIGPAVGAGILTYFGSAEGLTDIPAGQLTGTVADSRITTLTASKLTGALPAIDGSQLSGIISGVGISSDGDYIGSGTTTINFVGTGITISAPSSGVSTESGGGGGGGGGGGSISTDAQVKTNGQTALLDLANAQDHKITCTGTVTISCTGSGTEGESHTVRIINSGTATVGFSTYFLFPSGATPSLPTGSGDISLISFTINREGAVGISTQLLAGASLNFS